MNDDKDKAAVRAKDELSVEQLDKVAGGTPAQAAGTKTDKPHLSDILITKQQDNSTGKLIHE